MKAVVIILSLIVIDIVLDTVILGPSRVKSLLSYRFGRLFRRRRNSAESVYEMNTEFYYDDEEDLYPLEENFYPDREDDAE